MNPNQPIQVVRAHPNDDPVLTMLRTWDANLEQAGWDQPDQIATLRIIRGGVGLFPWPLALPPGFGGPDMVRDLTAEVRKDPEFRHNLRRLGADHGPFLGLAMTSEAWILTAPYDAVPADYLAAAKRREVFRHPDRIEARSCIAVATMAGSDRTWQIVRPRGGVPMVRTDNVAVAGPDAATPKLLATLATTLT